MADILLHIEVQIFENVNLTPFGANAQEDGGVFGPGSGWHSTHPMVFGLDGCVRRRHGHMAANHPAVGEVLTPGHVIRFLGVAATTTESHNRIELDDQHREGDNEQMTRQDDKQMSQSGFRGGEGNFLYKNK